ncbi:phosphotransferase family protein [Saccharopolyspora sp. CA-218241]|uniref:phosphotransferase family protein n=1 Tax=Saccharopolyspora sp. CA-218241 TaxID=3240027 RepID=UPI003D99AEF8
MLDELVAQADLPPPVSAMPKVGRGFDNEISTVVLAGGRRVVLRRFPQPRAPEWPRARFLEQHGLPAPALLAANERGSVIEFVDGDLLGDLIEAGRDTAGVWRMVGAAYRRVHAVGFPAGLAAEELAADRFVLTPVDPVEQLHRLIDNARPGLHQLLPDCVDYLSDVHALVDDAATALRTAASAFGHGDINMWNVLITPEQAVLIDWDHPRVADPAMEIALLDKHASLFNETGLPAAFFTGYGQPPPEPNTSLHRLVQTLEWATSSDWAEFESDVALPTELKHRVRGWLPILVDYLRELPTHVDRLRTLTGTPRQA